MAGSEVRMTRSEARLGRSGRSAPRAPEGYVSYADPARISDDKRALSLLSSVLAAPSRTALLATDPAGTLMLWSAGASALFGHKARAVLGKLSFRDLCPSAGDGGPGAADPDQALESALRDGAWHAAVPLDGRDGERRVAAVDVTPLRDGSHRHLGFLVAAWDITGEVRRAERLEADRFQARALFEANAAPLVTTDLLGVATDLNSATEALAGRGREELLGVEVTRYTTEPERAAASMRDTLASGRTSDVEMVVARPDGSTVPVLATSAVYADAEGRPQGILSSLLDLTERNSLRDDLQRSESYYRSLVEATADGLVALDGEGRIVDANTPLCRMSGFDRDQYLGAVFTECFRDPARAAEAVAQASAGGIELDLLAAEGPDTRVLARASRLGGEDGAANGARLVVSLRDISEVGELAQSVARERAYVRSVIDASVNGLIISDLSLRITDVNEAMCALAGRSRADLVGAALRSAFTDPGEVDDAIRRALLGGRALAVDLRVGPGEGTPAQANISVLRGEEGEPAGLLTSASDVSEQLRLRQKLETQEAYTRGIVESSAVALIIIGRDGAITDVNAGASTLTGHSRRRLVGRQFASLFTDPERARAGVSRAFEDGFLNDYELIVRPRDGGRRVTAFHAGVFTDPRNGQPALIGAVQDITDRKRDEEQLHVLTESLYVATTDVIVIMDSLGAISDVNRRMETLVGRSREELIGTHFADWCADPERGRDLLRAVLHAGNVTDCELTTPRPDGDAAVLSYSASTFSGRDGRLQGIFASGRDVTERKRFQQMQEDLLGQARELDQAKTDFVSRVSHELRSPLTSVLGYLELLSGDEPGPLTAEQRRMLEVVNRNGRRLLALIEDLLLLSRIEAGRITLSYGLVRMDSLVEGVHESFLPAARQGGLRTRLHVQPGVQLEGDESQLERVVSNLISNAVKFTPPGGEIHIICRNEGDEVVFEVRDTGVGVPEEEQSRLFTRFFRSSLSAEQEKQGTGLGLYIVKNVAQAHGGDVSVVSSPGEGSVFTVRLPVRAAAAATRA